jgi:hypothetical protein
MTTTVEIIDTDFACEIQPGDSILFEFEPYTVKAIEATPEGFAFTLLDRFEDESRVYFDHDDEIQIGWEVL